MKLVQLDVKVIKLESLPIAPIEELLVSKQFAAAMQHMKHTNRVEPEVWNDWVWALKVIHTLIYALQVEPKSTDEIGLQAPDLPIPVLPPLSLRPEYTEYDTGEGTEEGEEQVPKKS